MHHDNRNTTSFDNCVSKSKQVKGGGHDNHAASQICGYFVHDCMAASLETTEDDKCNNHFHANPRLPNVRVYT